MKIALVDDHSLILDGMKSMIERLPEVEHVATFESGIKFMEVYEESKFDLIITDVEMPGMTGTELVTKIRDQSKAQRILVMSMHKDHSLINNLFNLKVNGYIMKDASPDVMRNAIVDIIERDIYLPPEMQKILEKGDSKEEYDLTKREIEIVSLIARGLSNKEIGENCFISETTVKTHRKNIMLKLGLKNTAELVRYAIEKKFA